MILVRQGIMKLDIITIDYYCYLFNIIIYGLFHNYGIPQTMISI